MKINLFTLGDCTDVNTWSGLPYYFYHNLLAHSVYVRPIDLNAPGSAGYAVLRRLTSVGDRVLHPVRPGVYGDQLRRRRYRMLVNRRVRSAAVAHRDVDLNLFLTFSFSSVRYVPVPVVHFCDRTYEQHLEETSCTPTRSDRRFIAFDRENIERADLVLTTGEVCADFIRTRYAPRRVFCLRTGNSTDLQAADPEGLIAEKAAATDILFIGKGAHKRGADILIRAFRMFNARCGGRFSLHIVGVRPNELPDDLGAPAPDVRFHGYLDRAVPAEREQYNALVRAARLFVMPMRPGPFPGVIREVQLQCTPVIVSDVTGGPEILTHGHDAVLVNTLDPQAFADEMYALVHDADRWRRLALNGHLARRSNTWSNTVETFLEIVRTCNLV